MVNRSDLLKTLSNNDVELTYTKASGETVTRTITLVESKLLPTTGGVSNASEDSITAVDLTKGEWRTFKVANIKSATIVA